MKNLFSFTLALLLSLCFVTSTLPQERSTRTGNSYNNDASRLTNPLYEIRVSNIQTGSSSPLAPDAIYFDMYIFHTNLPDSGPFKFASGQYYLSFDTSIANGGTLSYEIVPFSTGFSNPDAVPTDPNIVGDQLRLARNIPLDSSDAPIVSSIFPGTRIARMKITTTAANFPFQNFYVAWIDSSGGAQVTDVYAFIDGENTNITGDGTFSIDSTNIVLPVELSAFASETNRNNVVLNWSTTSETNNSGFEIERSAVNSQWEKIGYIQGNGTTTSPKSYIFEDRKLNSGSYKYRLRQIDFNGSYKFYELSNEVAIGVPRTFRLNQNYPNPFNPVTKIDFDIPGDAFVSLKVFDIQGRNVRTLLNEFRNSGYYTIDFDAAALSSGSYYYRLESGNFSSTKKLVVLK